MRNQSFSPYGDHTFFLDEKSRQKNQAENTQDLLW